MVKYLSCFTQLNIWRRIEEAVTRLTRNQFVRKGTRVRIPPSPFWRLWTCRLAGPFSFGKDVLDERDWASIGKYGRACASRNKENGWKCGKGEVATLLGHLCVVFKSCRRWIKHGTL